MPAFVIPGRVARGRRPSGTLRLNPASRFFPSLGVYLAGVGSNIVDLRQNVGAVGTPTGVTTLGSSAAGSTLPFCNAAGATIAIPQSATLLTGTALTVAVRGYFDLANTTPWGNYVALWNGSLAQVFIGRAGSVDQYVNAGISSRHRTASSVTLPAMPQWLTIVFRAYTNPSVTESLTALDIFDANWRILNKTRDYTLHNPFGLSEIVQARIANAGETNRTAIQDVAVWNRCFSDAEVMDYGEGGADSLYWQPTQSIIDLGAVQPTTVQPQRPAVMPHRGGVRGVRPPTVFTMNHASPQAQYGFRGWWAMNNGTFRRVDRNGALTPLIIMGNSIQPLYGVTTDTGICGRTEMNSEFQQRVWNTGLPGALDGLSQFTVAYWVYRLDAAIGSAWGQGRLETTTFCELTGIYLNGGTDTRGAFTDPHTVGAFTHVAWVLGGGNLTLYKNGLFVLQVAATATITAAATHGFYIGGQQSGSGGASAALNALWQDFRVIPKALTANEVWQLYDPATRWDLYRPAAPQIVSAPGPDPLPRAPFIVTSKSRASGIITRPQTRFMPNMGSPQAHWGMTHWWPLNAGWRTWDVLSGQQMQATNDLYMANSSPTAGLTYEASVGMAVFRSSASSYSFSGPNDWTVNPGSAFSSAVWFRPTTGWIAPMSRWSGNVGWLGINASGKIRIYANSTIAEGTRTLTNSTPYHLCMTYDGITLRSYIDGQLDSSVVGAIGTPAVPIELASYSNGAGGSGPGMWADWRYFRGVCLSQPQIAQMANPATRWELYGNPSRRVAIDMYGDVIIAPAYAYPLTDLAAGAWTAVPSGSLASVVDDVTPDDADYIQSSAGGASDVAQLGFGALTPPIGEVSLVIRHKKP